MRQQQYLFFILLINICNGFSGFGQESPGEWKDGEDLLKKTAKYLFLKVSVDKNDAYIGESIVAKYQLYVAVDIQGQLAKAPSYRGFAAYDMQNADNVSYKVESLHGINYRVYLIKIVQLFGLKPGTQILEPVELDASVQYRRQSTRQTDSGPVDTVFNYTAISQPVKVTIKPLPIAPKNTKTGGVGNFEMNATLSKPEIEVNKSDTFTITILGKGSWHEIQVPKVEWPNGLEIFEPSIKENLDPLSIPVSGIRTLQYPIVASTPGRYVLPPLKFTFFNPEKKQFTTLQTDSLILRATPATLQNQERAIANNPTQNITDLFTRFAVVLFPLTALLLIVLVVLRKKRP